MDEAQRQAVIDGEHLRLLRIGYFISAGLSALFAAIGLLYAGLGAFVGTIVAHAPATPGNAPPPEIGWIFGLFGLGFMLLSGTITALKLRTAWCLRQRRSRGLCLVTAAISCLEMPYGTALGVFTFMTLSRPSVLQLFSDRTGTHREADEPART